MLRQDTNVIFQTAIFLILVVSNNKRSSGIDDKTRDCLSRNCLIAVILNYISATNCSLNRLNLWLLFFRWFPHETTKFNYSKRFGIFSDFCVFDLIYFLFNLVHTKTIKLLMCENEQKPEPWKKRDPEPEPHSWKPRAPELELCHFYDGSAALK